jgi:hypothetical protein
VVRAGTDWMLPFLGSAWRYTQLSYGDFKASDTSDGRFYAIFHQGRYEGGHAGYYQDLTHDSRNVSDCGPGPWASPTLIGPHFAPLWLMGSVVEHSSHHFFTSPINNVWGNNFKDIFMYDVLLAVGHPGEAQAAYDVFMANVDINPRPSTHWFRDWFFPVWRDHGHGQVLAKFFTLLAQFKPTTMTLPEMVHFMSGAAGTNLKVQAVTAFGAEFVNDAALQKARLDYPQISYDASLP